MKSLINISSAILMTVSTIALSPYKIKQANAIGCDTYYRVTGEIAGCTDISTEKARELWIEKYSVCLEQQLAEEILNYSSEFKVYYAQETKNIEHNSTLDNIVFQGLKSSTISLSESRQTIQEEQDDFCH